MYFTDYSGHNTVGITIITAKTHKNQCVKHNRLRCYYGH